MVRWIGLWVIVGLLLIPATSLHSQDTTPKGNRILGIDVNSAENEDYDTTFNVAYAMGIGEVGLSLDWVDLEPSPNTYAMTYPEIANVYYPAYGVPVSLTIRPIHTNTLRVPSDLQGLAFDDPRMIERFNALLDEVFAAIPDLELSSLVIGSEFDIYLGTDPDQWAAYTIFATATADHARSLRPDLKVAFEATYAAIANETMSGYLATLNAQADIIGVSHYPINADFSAQDPSVVHEVFATVVEAYPNQPIYFYQFGYPSSALLGSSEAKQAEFIRQAFLGWDAYAENIIMIDFTWFTEQSPEVVASFQTYYSYADPSFAAFLGSLGLRNYDGTPKLALATLQAEAAARGW